MLKKSVVIVLFLMMFFPSNSFARIGVGIGTGKIEINEELKPGGIYTLPPITVLNTGDESSNYGLSIEFHQDQLQFSPDANWFSFNPDSFMLEPEEAEVVKIKLSLPLKVIPGEYFAYLEAHPEKKSTTPGGATIGIASAAKLYFTVAPSNVWQGVYYKLVSFWKLYYPWPCVFCVIVAFSLLTVIFKRFFSFQIGITKKKNAEEKEESE